jgi:hypothetical protein
LKAIIREGGRKEGRDGEGMGYLMCVLISAGKRDLMSVVRRGVKCPRSVPSPEMYVKKTEDGRRRVEWGMVIDLEGWEF